MTISRITRTTTALLVAFSALVSFPSLSQTKSVKTSPLLVEAAPATVGMSAERLNKIDLMLKNAVDQKEIPGAVALIVRNGKIVFYNAYGMADNTTGRAMKKDDIFRIASQTKAITATAVMMLWEEGKFNLDDPISKYIPEFGKAQILDTFNEKDSSYTTKPAKNQITIRHLLTHTSGVGYGAIDNEKFRKIYAKAGITDAFTTEPVNIADNIKKLAKLPLHQEPGERWVYSEGLDVLGYLIEIISGMPFDKFLRTRLFEPLGMNDTYFYIPDNKKNRLVSVQQKTDGEWKKYPGNFFDSDYPIKGAKTFFSGGGGLSSTAKDYATFLQMYLNGGELNGVRILSRKTIETIMANQIGDAWQGNYQGLAFQVMNQKQQDAGGQGSAGTFQWGGYFNTQYFADPKEKLIGILMKQTAGEIKDETGWRFKLMAETAIDD
ncbi:MAG: beta-lactamase family protein [Chitinophagaceae bacterium]|jgi:CubicO group peptidase (beta-lactamase class C family)|nr:beta-lactamase family protein [Chitinophagaceae bacterium]